MISPLRSGHPRPFLKVGSEGGGLALARKTEGGDGYQFWTEGDETTMSELLDDDDLVGVGDLSRVVRESTLSMRHFAS